MFKLAKFINKKITFLPAYFIIYLNSWGRVLLMKKFYKTKISSSNNSNFNFSRKLWNLEFKGPLFNSAGMFKNNEGYAIAANQEAAAYIGGTSTYNQRKGNFSHGIKLPFVTLEKSKAAINYLGLPNFGDQVLSHQQITTKKVIPIGMSVMRSSDFSTEIAIERLIASLWLYHNNSEIDFIEINESCPNVQLGIDDIVERLGAIATKFIQLKSRPLPIVVKFSVDIKKQDLLDLIDVLIQLKFDGVNIGNTSTNYAKYREEIDGSELKIYDYFTQNFGGGISGQLLKQQSLTLCEAAVLHIKQLNLNHEFHVIRSAGIDCAQDLIDSENIGVALNQWYTGYFDNYIKYGDAVYKKILNDFGSLKALENYFFEE
jgi:dihydroorotate dehydrogenase